MNAETFRTGTLSESDLRSGTYLVRKFEEWLERQVKPGKNESVLAVDLAYAKPFALPAVEWHGARSVTVRGTLLIGFARGR